MQLFSIYSQFIVHLPLHGVYRLSIVRFSLKFRQGSGCRWPCLSVPLKPSDRATESWDHIRWQFSISLQKLGNQIVIKFCTNGTSSGQVRALVWHKSLDSDLTNWRCTTCTSDRQTYDSFFWNRYKFHQPFELAIENLRISHSLYSSEIRKKRINWMPCPIKSTFQNVRKFHKEGVCMISEIYIHKSQNNLEKEIAFEQFTLNMSTPVQFTKDWTCLFYIFTMVNSFIISNLESWLYYNFAGNNV